MKKTLFLPLAVLMCNILFAQTIQDAKRSLYYERYQSAAKELQAVLKNDPSNAEAWYLLAQAQVQAEATDNLQKNLMEAPENVKGEPLYQVALGYALLQQNKVDSARQYFDMALNKTRQKNADVLLAVARAHIETKAGDANYAIELLNKAAKRAKKNPEIPYAIGDAYRKLNNGTEAFKAYREALSKDENHVPSMYKLGKIFTTQKNAEMYLPYFNQALAADSLYAPALYDLYFHYYFRDAAKAMDYFKKYLAHSDPNPKNDYAYTDLLYLNKQYNEAITEAGKLIQRDGEKVQPRIYKLIAYSYKDQNDLANAGNYMNQYFTYAHDSNFIVKDYETMAQIYAGLEGKQDSAAAFYEKALGLEKDSTLIYAYYKKLADLQKGLKNYTEQAKWLGKYFQNNDKATNVDMFNWGLAHYMAKEYQLADTVFADYSNKYPEQAFGFYWRARANVAIDTAMTEGLAIPHYMKLIEVASKDAENETNKKWLKEAFGYIAAYKANTEKDYAAAIEYFEKLLQIEPENNDAKRYISILKKNLGDTAGSKGGE